MKKVITSVLAGALMITSTFAFAEDVYATKNGKRYHKADCLLVKDKGAKSLPMEEALKKGLKPCRRCFGEGDLAKNSTKEDLTAKSEAVNVPITAEATK